MVPAKIRRAIEKYQMFKRTDRILAGVSGGADSLCLMLVLKELGYDVSVAHLNHGLRGAEADADEQFVREAANLWSMPFFSKRVCIPADYGNVEAAGRRARKEFFAELVENHGFSRIAVAHSRDDRVETFFLNLLRGTGVEGLTAMEPVAGPIVRPLLEVTRVEIESYLCGRQQNWRQDSTNRDVQFARNRLRLEVLPSLAESFNANLPATIVRTMEILGDESAVLETMAQDWLARHGTKQDETYVMDCEALVSQPAGLQRRIVRAAMKRFCDSETSLFDVGFAHVEAVRRLLFHDQSGKTVHLPGGVAFSRSFDRLLVNNRLESAQPFDYELQIPGEVHIPELKRRFRATIVSDEVVEGRTGSPSEWGNYPVFVDGRNIGQYVRIRNWKPGDYYRPVGMPAGKLKKLFQRARIPRSQRHRWPVFVNDSSIIWVASFPISREFAPRGCSQRIVAFEASPI